MNRLVIVGILMISTAPLYAQGQQPDIAKWKADAQKVASIIKSDKAKIQTYCQMSDIAEQMDQAEQEKDRKTAEVLVQKLTELEKGLGPEYLALVESLRATDLTSKDRQEILSTFDTIDDSCPD